MTGLRLYVAIGAAVLVAVALGWALRLDVLRASWKSKYELLSAQAAAVLLATRDASGNPALSWPDAAAQIVLLGNSKRAWQDTAMLQSARIDALGIETARLKALSAEARQRAEAIIAKRDSAIARLSAQAVAPGERADCVAQLRDAEAALDLVYREGV